MRTIAFGLNITGGALITAWRSPTEKRVRSFLPAGIVTCSWYVPRQTLIIAPGVAASTASWMRLNCQLGQSRPSSSTISMCGGGGAVVLAVGPTVDSSDGSTPNVDRAIPSGSRPVTSGTDTGGGGRARPSEGTT